MNTFNGQFAYQRNRNRDGMSRGHIICDLAIYQRDDGQALVIAHARWDNPGKRSITDSAEDLAEAVMRHFTVSPESTTFIEHYNAFSCSENPTLLAIQEHPDTYSKVIHTWKGREVVAAPRFEPVIYAELQEQWPGLE